MATAQFVVTRKPVVTVDAADPPNGLTYCEDYGVPYVDVAFQAQADDPGVDLDVPLIIEASDGRNCNLNSRKPPHGPGECGCRRAVSQSFWLWCCQLVVTTALLAAMLGLIGVHTT